MGIQELCFYVYRIFLNDENTGGPFAGEGNSHIYCLLPIMTNYLKMKAPVTEVGSFIVF